MVELGYKFVILNGS